jgi:F420H(2)-dependent quinone reductase
MHETGCGQGRGFASFGGGWTLGSVWSSGFGRPLGALKEGPPNVLGFVGMNPLLESVMGPLLTVHQWLYENTDGRIGASLGGRPMLLLRTVGRRTREPRTAALLYVRDAKAYVVIASKGGAPQHPGWFHNLTAEPNVEIQVGRERIPVRARIAEGEERSRLWARADDINQGQYTIYQSRTKRPIPVVVLEPR